MKPLPLQTTTALLHFHSEYRDESHGSSAGRNTDKDSRNESEPESEKDTVRKDAWAGEGFPLWSGGTGENRSWVA